MHVCQLDCSLHGMVCVCVCARTSAPMCTLPASVCVCEQVPTYCTLPAVHFHAPQSQSSGYPRFCCCCSYSHLPKAKHRMIEAEQERERGRYTTMQYPAILSEESPSSCSQAFCCILPTQSFYRVCAHTTHGQRVEAETNTGLDSQPGMKILKFILMQTRPCPFPYITLKSKIHKARVCMCECVCVGSVCCGKLR